MLAKDILKKAKIIRKVWGWVPTTHDDGSYIELKKGSFLETVRDHNEHFPEIPMRAKWGEDGILYIA